MQNKRNIGDVLAEWTGVVWTERWQRRGNGVVLEHPHSAVSVVSNLSGWKIYKNNMLIKHVRHPSPKFSDPRLRLKDIITSLTNIP